MGAIRLLHTSDVHIGASFEFLRAKGAEQRLAVRETFERVSRLAREGDYDLLLIAGDLFDDPYAASQRDVSFVLGCLGSAGPACRVVLLPGSHDHWAPGGVFERERERFEACGNVTILVPEHPAALIPELSLAVCGKAIRAGRAAENPIAGLAPAAGVRWNVAMAHGSVAGASPDHEPGEHPIRLDELAPGFDYIALGHWHSYNVIRTEAPPVVYSGAPELIARDQAGAGSVVSVSLTEEGVSFERIPVGRRRVERPNVDCAGISTTEELISRILGSAEAGADTVLEVTLSGMLDGGAVVDPGLALELLEGRFFSVRFSGPLPEREISREEMLRVPEGTVAGAFVRLLLERIDEAAGEERERLKEALQAGCQLFRGRNLLG